MSDDIVARLLRFRPVYDWPEETSTVVEKPLNQVAADEITRLRAELAAVTAERDMMKEVLKDVVSAAYSTRASIGVPCIDIQVIDRARAALEGVTKKKETGNE